MDQCGGISYQCGGEGGEEDEEEKASEEKDEKKQTCVDQEDGPEPCDNGDDNGEGSSSEEEDDCFTQRDACVQVGDGRVPPLKGEGCSHTVSFFGTEPKWMIKRFFIIIGYHLHHHFVVIS